MTSSGSFRFLSRFLGLFAVLTVLLVGGRMPAEPAVAAREFDPAAFFTGPTEGHGLLKVFSSAQATHVTGVGTMRPNGVLVIDQMVVIGGEKTTNRHWEIHQTKPGAFSGTISDAKGPMTGVVSGNRMQIRYKTLNGLSVAQILTVAPDARSLHNAMKIRKFGIVVATIDETIRKL